MKILYYTFIFLLIFLACRQKSPSPVVITVLKSRYELRLGGDSVSVNTPGELTRLLEKKSNSADSIYIRLLDAPASSLELLLQELKAKEYSKYRVLVEDEYFFLPY